MPYSDRNPLHTSSETLSRTRVRLAASHVCEEDIRMTIASTRETIVATEKLIHRADICLHDYGTLRHRPG